MRPRRDRPAVPAVRRRAFVLAAALAAFALAAPPVAGHAQDRDGKDHKDGKGGKGGGNKDEEEKEAARKRRKDVCEKVAAEFARGDSAALVSRAKDPDSKSLQLALEASATAYKPNQARGVLDAWFKGKKDLKAEVKTVTAFDGTADVSWREDGTDKTVRKKLYITLEGKKSEPGVLHLVKLEVL